MITIDTSRALSDGINALNARRTSRAEAVANVIVATVLGVLGVALLLHYAAPCVPEGSLCAMPATRFPLPGWLLRARLALRAWYLQVLINAAEQDVAHHEEMAELSPQLAHLCRLHVEALRVQLADCELATRRG